MAVEAARDARPRRRRARCGPLRDPEPAVCREAERRDDPGGARSAASRSRSVELGGSSRMGLGALLLGLDLAAAGRRALVCAGDVVVGASGRRAREPGRRRRGGVRDRRRRRGDRSAASAARRRRSRSSTCGGCRRSASGGSGRSASPPTRWRRRSSTRRSARSRARDVEPSSLSTVILDGTNPRSMAGLPKALGLKARAARRSARADGRTDRRRARGPAARARARQRPSPATASSSCARPTAPTRSCSR